MSKTVAASEYLLLLFCLINMTEHFSNSHKNAHDEQKKLLASNEEENLQQEITKIRRVKLSSVPRIASAV